MNSVFPVAESTQQQQLDPVSSTNSLAVVRQHEAKADAKTTTPIGQFQISDNQMKAQKQVVQKKEKIVPKKFASRFFGSFVIPKSSRTNLQGFNKSSFSPFSEFRATVLSRDFRIIIFASMEFLERKEREILVKVSKGLKCAFTMGIWIGDRPILGPEFQDANFQTLDLIQADPRRIWLRNGIIPVRERKRMSRISSFSSRNANNNSRHSSSDQQHKLKRPKQID